MDSDRIIKRCACGRAWTFGEWQAIAHKDWQALSLISWECSCGSSIAIPSGYLTAIETLAEVESEVHKAHDHLAELRDTLDELMGAAQPSVVCAVMRYQQCHVCDRLDCGDNTTEAARINRAMEVSP